MTNRADFEPYRTGLWCVKVARDMNPEKFDWRRETYEFVSDRLAIDLLAGTDRYRDIVEENGDFTGWIGVGRAAAGVRVGPAGVSALP